MNKSILGLLALLLAIGVGAAIWFTRSDASEDGPSAAHARTAVVDESDSQTSELSGPSTPDDDTATGAALVSDSETTEIATREVEARADASGQQTLRGRVILPPGTPADEVLIVLASTSGGFPTQLANLDDDPNGAVRVDVDDQGYFEHKVSAATNEISFQARGHYLFSAEPTKVQLPSKVVFELELEPELGARVSGRFLPPADATEAQLVELDEVLQLAPDMTSMLGMGGFSGNVPRTEVTKAWTDEPLAFEFSGVPPESKYELQSRPKALAATTIDLDPLAPGEHRRVDIALKFGGTISGRVVDDNGKPLEGVAVKAEINPMMFGQGGMKIRDAKTDADGRYTLVAIAAGPVTLSAELDGYLNITKRVDVEDLQLLDSVELVLDSGNSVAGTVHWPDGTPVVDEEVDVEFDASYLGGMEAFNAMRGADGEADTDEQGNFVVSGLGNGPFTLSIRAQRTVDGETRHGSARLDGVRPGTLDVALVVSPPLGVSGHVVDDLGNPVTEFTVTARTKSSGMLAGLGAESSTGSFESDEGEFFLGDLREGEWELIASQEGYGRATPQPVTLPAPDGTDVIITLERAASVTGTVLDSTGAAVADATVGPQLTLSDLGGIGSGMGAPPSATADAEGRFELTGLPSGAISLVAAAPGYADSKPLGLELTPAETIDGQILTLRVGGSIRGVVLDNEGEPFEDQTVMVQNPTLPTSQKWAISDSKGEFLFESMAEGSYQVMTFPRGGGALEGGGSGESEDFAAMFSDMKFTMTDVVDGEESYVTLGALPENPVQLSGRVVADDEPVSGAMVTFLADGADDFDSLKFVTTDSNGEFEAELGKPGRYMVNVQKMIGTGQQQSVEYQREIPEGEAHEILFELPLAGISGTVRNPDGDPLANARVTLGVDGPISNGSFTGGNYSEIWTDADGGYELLWLRPGDYTVAAGGAFMGGLFGDAGDKTFGRQVRRGLSVSEGQWLRGVDFKLQEPGKIVGQVLDGGGAPVTEAAIFLRDDEGNSIDRITTVQTDAAGRFEYSSLEPGTYEVTARTKDEVSFQAVPARVTSGNEANVTLRLSQGTMLIVSLSDREGNPVRCRVRVTGPDGRQVNGLWSLADLMTMFSGSGSISSDQQRVGPLAPGKYKIEATTDDGRDAKKSVTLSGQAERKVKLRLD